MRDYLCFNIYCNNVFCDMSYSFTENSFVYTRVFHTNGLMRTRLTPDTSKMLICTTSGYLIVIHNLKLSTLSQDLQGFKVHLIWTYVSYIMTLLVLNYSYFCSQICTD